MSFAVGLWLFALGFAIPGLVVLALGVIGLIFNAISGSAPTGRE